KKETFLPCAPDLAAGRRYAGRAIHLGSRWRDKAARVLASVRSAQEAKNWRPRSCPKLTSSHGQLRHTQDAGSARVASSPSPLSRSLHAKFRVLAQAVRALL